MAEGSVRSAPSPEPDDGPLVVIFQVSTTEQDGRRVLHRSDGSDVAIPEDVASIIATFADPHGVAHGFAGPERSSSPERACPRGDQAGTAEPGQPVSPEQDASRELELATAQVRIGELLGSEVCREICTAMDEGRQVRLALRIAPGDPAWDLPWEYVRPSATHGALVLSPGCGVARVVPVANDQAAATTASQDAGERLDGGRQVRSSGTVTLLDLARAGDTSFTTLREWHKERAAEAHDDACPDLCVVVGHGGDAGIQDHGLAELITSKCGGSWPALVVLVVCRSARTGPEQPSVAASLVAAGAPAVVGMAGDIETIGVAPAFVNAVWSARRAGASLLTSVAAGRVAVAQFGSLWQYGLAVLTVPSVDLLHQRDDVSQDLARSLTELRQLVVVANSDVGGDVVGSVHPQGAPVGGSHTEVVVTGSTVGGSVIGSVIGAQFRR